MNTKVNKAYFLIPVIYAAVIISLLYVQFSGSRGFSAEVSGIKVSGRTHAGAPGRGDYISALQVSCNGISFSFDEGNPMLVYSRDGLTHNTVPINYRITATSIDLRLNKDISISFSAPQNSENIINISLSAGDPDSIKSIEIPLIEAKGSVIEMLEGVPVLSVTTSDDSRYFLSLPEGVSFDAETGNLQLLPEGGGFSDLSFEKSVNTSLDAFTYWFSGNSKLVSAEALENNIASYLEKTISGFMDIRFKEESGTWTSKTGLPEFNEEALVAAVSEQIGKAEYPRAKSSLDRSAEKYSDDLGILSSSLFGNIVNEGWAYNRNLERKLSSLERRTANHDYSVFTDEDLSTLVLSEDSDVLTKNLLKMADSLPEADINIREASGMLWFYWEINNAYAELGSKFAPLLNVVEKIILPSIEVVSDRLFIVDDKKNADILLSLKTGIVMKGIKEKDGLSNINSLGREIINSALSISDNLGFLPKTAWEGESGNLLTENNIPPEHIYPLLSDNPYYPAKDYFFSETGEKLTVLNQAETFNTEKTDFGYKMTFKFPAGQIHTFAVRNIKPFYQMNLLGYKWNADHRFLQYFSGWWYDRDTQTLYVKIRHRTDTEEILIYTDKPAPLPPKPEESTDAGAAEDETAGPKTEE
ncbi:MAG: hypothetical protein JEZ04_11335 [Spirochaetales bacterium]|nr:hypothetical protein [Spirochaetales bacterium]